MCVCVRACVRACVCCSVCITMYTHFFFFKAGINEFAMTDGDKEVSGLCLGELGLITIRKHQINC